MPDDDKTPPEVRKPPPSHDEWGHEFTGPMRRVVHEELENKFNGTLDRLEKGQRWGRVITYFLGILVSACVAVVAVDHWVNSLAKKSELDQLNDKISSVDSKINTIKSELRNLAEAEKRRAEDKKKPARWGD